MKYAVRVITPDFKSIWRCQMSDWPTKKTVAECVDDDVVKSAILELKYFPQLPRPYYMSIVYSKDNKALANIVIERL